MTITDLCKKQRFIAGKILVDEEAQALINRKGLHQRRAERQALDPSSNTRMRTC